MTECECGIEEAEDDAKDGATRHVRSNKDRPSVKKFNAKQGWDAGGIAIKGYLEISIPGVASGGVGGAEGRCKIAQGQ